MPNLCALPVDLLFRPAWDDEKLRVARLFPEAAAPGDCFVAVRERPVERIVGAAFWRELAGPEGACIADFSWGALPALAGTPAEKDFLLALKAALAGKGRATLMRSAAALPEGPESRLLQDCGFEPAYRQDCYLGEWSSWLRRTAALLARFAGKARETDLLLATPAPIHAEALAELAVRHNLLAAQDVYAALAPSGSTTKFDPRYSALLLQGERLAGACLVKRHGSQIVIPVLVVDGAASTGIGCARLFAHCQHALAGSGVEKVQFRTNPEMSPAMPRLARRFDCHAVGSQSAWRISLHLGTSGAGGAGNSTYSIHPPP